MPGSIGSTVAPKPLYGQQGTLTGPLMVLHAEPDLKARCELCGRGKPVEVCTTCDLELCCGCSVTHAEKHRRKGHDEGPEWRDLSKRWSRWPSEMFDRDWTYQDGTGTLYR